MASGMANAGETHTAGRTGAVERVLNRYRSLIAEGLHDAIAAARASTLLAPAAHHLLDELYGQIEYHFGWRDADLRPTKTSGLAGKLLRPAMLLLACELAAGDHGASATEQAEAVQRSVPAAVAVELVHNFSLVHDDIEDGDEERHHRPTLWALWGVPQAINTGDGIFAMARMELLRLVERGVAPALVVELAALLDRTCLALCEGQFLDMRFEGQHEISVALYLDMIARKTAALMACACAMGGRLGAPHDLALAEKLAAFGRALGLAFQLRDDLLGIWEAQALGKSADGDLRRKKMTLPVIAALEAAAPADHEALLRIYAEPVPASEDQVALVRSILDQTGARERARAVLREQCETARLALEAAAPAASADRAADTNTTRGAYDALAALLDFIAAEAAPNVAEGA